jgi:hypothetical protein
MTIILTIALTLLVWQLLPRGVDPWTRANRTTAVTVLAAVAVLAGVLAVAAGGGGEAPITPTLLQQAARAAEADGGGYDYACQLNGAPRQIICQGQGASVAFLVTPSGQLQPEPGTGQ